MDKSKLKMGLAGVVLSIASLYPANNYFSNKDYTITVTDKERVVKNIGEETTSKYLVFTKLDNGETRVFENTDALVKLKFNSSDIQAELVEGNTYNIKAYGWRIPILSAYENIVSVDK